MDDFYNLLSKYILKESSEKDLELLNGYLEESDEHKEIFKQMVKISRLQESYSLSINTTKGWNKIKSKVKSQKKRRIIIPYLAIAASLCTLFFIAKFYYQKNNITWTTIYNYDSKAKNIALNDGTIIWLNKNSHIKFPKKFEATKRELILSGEAFFDVQANNTKPFYIKTKNTITKVLGTSFNIRAYPKQKKETINVLTGKVKFYDHERNQIILEKGMSAEYSVNTTKIISRKTTNSNVLAWKTKEFIFKNKSLEDVLHDLQKVYNFEYIIKNQALEQKLVTTKFKELSIDEIVDLLAQSLDFSYQKNENLIIIK
ncbi:MAG: FecR family protein [Bacteroidales bacterium]|nr:FecR family protein [Bacteroidales bacterium]